MNEETSTGGPRPRRGRPDAGPGSARDAARGGAPSPDAARAAARQPRSSGQAGAVNRSRPIYDDARDRVAPRGRARGRAVARHANRPAPTRRPSGERRCRRCPPNPREAALRILHAVDTRSAFSDRLLEGAHAQAERGAATRERDQALLHELVKGTLRWRGRLDYALDPAGPHRALAGAAVGQERPALGAYQILFLDRVPPHAAVDESVKLAHKYGHPGTAGLVNSVLRRLADEKDAIALPEGDDPESLAAWGSHPLWIVERWLARFGAEATRELHAREQPPGAASGCASIVLRGTREQLIERLGGRGRRWRCRRAARPTSCGSRRRAPAGRLKAFQRGLVHGAGRERGAGRAPGRRRSRTSACSTCAPRPGGKCTHLAELMGDEGEVWAMERAPERASVARA